jgi:imidazolonepropionase-like amidohydrolase
MSEQFLLHNLRLVDATLDQAMPSAAVWVRGNVIAAAGPEAEVRAKLDTTAFPREIDMGGRYISPGLINMHTHLSLSLPGPRGALVKGMNDIELALYMADGAARTLQNGVTSIRCVGE